MEELKDVEKRRRNLGLTQVRLARLAGVSQSMIAKLERGLIDVAYSKAQSIFKALEKEERKEETIAEDIMTKKLISTKKTDKSSKPIAIMKKLRISQIPVLQGDLSIGSITEESLLNKIREGFNPKKLGETKVEEIMEEAFPTISKTAGLYRDSLIVI